VLLLLSDCFLFLLLFSLLLVLLAKKCLLISMRRLVTLQTDFGVMMLTNDEEEEDGEDGEEGEEEEVEEEGFFDENILCSV
jgi:hypothetical protein